MATIMGEEMQTQRQKIGGFSCISLSSGTENSACSSKWNGIQNILCAHVYFFWFGFALC